MEKAWKATLSFRFEKKSWTKIITKNQEQKITQLSGFIDT